MIALVRLVIAFSKPARIHRVGLLIDIDKDRTCTAVSNGLGRRHECVGDGDHFVARFDAGGEQRKPKRFCSAAKRDAMRRVTISSKLLFELFDERATSERLRCRSPPRLRA